MKNWYVMKKSSSYLSGFENEVFDFYAQDGFEELLSSFQAREVILYGNKIADGRESRAIIQNLTSDSINNASVRQILLRIGDGNGVQYVCDKQREEYWLVNSLPSDNGIYQKLIAWYCKSKLKFVSPLTGQVVEYPVYIVNATQYNSGETNKLLMTLGSSQYLVYIPYNKETIILDNGFRFLLDRNSGSPTAYKLTQVDTASYSFKDFGLIQWTIVEDQFSPTYDSKELMIADYYNERGFYSIQIENIDSTLSIKAGDCFAFTVNCFRNDELCPNDEVAYMSDNEEVAVIDQYGVLSGLTPGVCNITVSFHEKSITVPVTVSMAAVPDTYNIAITNTSSNDTVIYGDTKTFRVQIYKNGIRYDIPFKAEITDSKIAEIISLNNDSLTIKVVSNKKNVGKCFILRAWNEELQVEDTIKLKVGDLW